jgi:hypothetical protein
MLRIIFTSLLMVNAIFWGIYPPSEDSPHSLVLKYLNIDYKPTKYFHIILGSVFYILGTLIAQQKSINNYWF